MGLYKFLTFSLLTILIISCNGANSSTKKNFSLEISNNKKDFKPGETVQINLKNENNIQIDRIEYELEGKKTEVLNNTLSLANVNLGKQELTATVYYGDKSEKITKNITILSNTAPVIYTYKIINEYPHDINSFTQGLEFHNDTLYESTGRNGHSYIRKTDYKTGKVLKQTDLDKAYFGEGITIINNKVYQLTWRKMTGFVYDLNSFEQLETFKYGNSKEGWGLTNDGKKIFKSDGTEKIWFLNPDTLTEEGYIQTVTNTSVFNKANELEYVDGKIYANVWQKDSAMIIDANTGAIIGVIDFRGLKDKVTKHEKLDVLNGIAYNSSSKTFFITGKNWDKLFEVEIMKK
ncbi:glutaminyl-peptide cyclotransferase [Abyssalbus ytuae]|uniref:Glutaminyl-peptide cyclotransferase n=1 Tax=Abyssalbus ytuae TaxID=2926907 RepID=A0A9E6ZJV4_9FLAO|nr:glutaminyl-peptide cyclotransferase [Abyssalbus ytuae]UOB16949.1 glutaminyl-peptide cyclotransferase [Abyssalbus ytuae]